MSQQFIKDLPELIAAGILNKDTAEKIQLYYARKKESTPNRLIIIFGVLGALLVGLGIILIIAHNWDNMGRLAKTILAFIPLLIGQIACIFTLIKKNESVVWRESSGTFTFFAMGSVISLVSQIYNIPGNTSSFLLTWTLIAFPLIYLMRSSFVSLLYLIGITYYAMEAEYSYYTDQYNYYIILLILVIPNYIILYRSSKRSNFFTFHSWLLALSVLISMGTYSIDNEHFMVLAYFCLFGAFYLLGKSIFFNELKPINNSYLLLGGFGMTVMLLTLSFDFFWKELMDSGIFWKEVITTTEFILAILMAAIAATLLVFNKIKHGWTSIDINEFIFVLFIFLFFMGFKTSIPVIITINLILLASGLHYVIRGVKQHHLLIMNYGLLIITGLIICRFFDTDLSFVFRGILFVGIGVAFFLTNFMILKKKKTLSEEDKGKTVKEISL